MSLIESREMIEWDSLKSIRLHRKIKVYKITTRSLYSFTDFFCKVIVCDFYPHLVVKRYMTIE